jgi:Spy/CpxP family protein refolding chaperone
MKKFKLVIAAIAVLATCTGLSNIASAEEAPAKGPQRGNVACGCAMGKQMNADSHLAKMATCLGLSEDQKVKIKPILEQNFMEMQALRADKNITRQQRRAKMQELRVKLHDQIKPLLTPEQNSKVAGMWTARGPQGKMGNCRMKPGHHGKDFRMDPSKHLARMTTCMGLSAEQQAKIKPILEENYAQKQAVHADKTLTKEQRRAKMQELRGQLHEKIKPVLTPEQLKKFDAPKGPMANQPKNANCPLMK